MNKILFIATFGFLVATAFALPLERITDENEVASVGEYGNHIEGDMILTGEQMDALYSPARNGLISKSKHWPNKTVYYQLSTDHTKEQRDYIELALRTMESVSCLKFVRRTNQKDYIAITAENGGCFSDVGYQSGKQQVNLQKDDFEIGCFRQGTIMHEFLHALGFYHMQSAYDRDDYVKIHEENILFGHKRNFIKYTSSEVTHFNTVYDYDSVLHYSAFAFSKNGEPTIVPVGDLKLDSIGQRVGMSEKDIYKLNAMYECDGVSTTHN